MAILNLHNRQLKRNPPKQNDAGFTLIELLVVIAIIALLASVVLVALNGARAKSRDAKRLADVRQIASAMELYYGDKFGYPAATASLVPNYLGTFPTNPTPNDGGCGTTNPLGYVFAQGSTNASYTLSFCLGNTTGSYPGGPHTLTQNGIQ